MGKAGRPRLLQKDGFHRHDGYDRLHPLNQMHRPDLHAELGITDAPQLVIKDNTAGEIHDLISKLAIFSPSYFPICENKIAALTARS